MYKKSILIAAMVDTPLEDMMSHEEVVYRQQNLGIGSANGQMRKRLSVADSGRKKPPSRSPPPTKKQKTDNIQEIEEKMYQLERKSTDVLFSARTVFPFDLFPDTLTISANKIDIVSSQFFFSNQTTSIPLRDIANVEIQTAPFFATLRIINIRYPMHPSIIRFLKKNDALKAKNIIDGLLVAMSQGADIAAIEPHRLLSQIETVGKSSVKE
jgi:hypothetical protein